MIELYKQKIIENKVNTFFICVGDKNYNIEKIEIVPTNPTCNCYSIAKAFTVMAIGLLYDKGLLNVDMLLVDILKKYVPNNIDKKWRNVTINDLLLHKVGFDHGLLDIDEEDASLYSTTDYLKIIFDTKLKYDPGTFYQYTDAAYYLLSRVVKEISKVDLEEFLRPTLMKKMKFKEMAWSKCPNGYSMGATGLYIRTEDMIKLGILFLNKGVWMGEQILSEDWINLVIKKEYEFAHIKNGWYCKGGMRGQLLMFNFNINKAVACHSYELKNLQEILLNEL